MLELIILAVLGTVVVAYLYTDDKYEVTSPAIVVRQTLHWWTFGALALKDATLLAKDATINANTTAELSIAESGQQIEIGGQQGAEQYKASSTRETLVSARVEVRKDTAFKRAKLKEIRSIIEE